MTRTHLISATVVTESPEEAVKAAELFQRIAVGMALEGISVRMDFTSYENDDEEDEVSRETPPQGENPHEA